MATPNETKWMPASARTAPLLDALPAEGPPPLPRPVIRDALPALPPPLPPPLPVVIAPFGVATYFHGSWGVAKW